MTSQTPPPIGTGFDPTVIQGLLEGSQFYDNTAQEFIHTTADKLKLCLIEHRDALNAKNSWIAPLGIFIALLATLVAADFHDFLGFTAEVWESIHIVAIVLSGLWLARALWRAWASRESSNIDNLVRQIKLGTEE